MKLTNLLLVMVLLSITAIAQDFGVWQDFQYSKQLNKTIDLVGGVRFDTKNDSKDFSEYRGYIGLSFKQGRFTAQPMVVFLKNFARVPFRETRPQITLSYRGNIGRTNITPRVRAGYHAKPNKNTGRVVPILHLDRRLSKNWGVFQTTEFWLPIGNSRDLTRYRKRFFVGVSRTVNKHLTVEPFLLYQRDEYGTVHNTLKFGTTWKIK